MPCFEHGMSVYRTFDDGPPTEFSVQRAAVKRKRPSAPSAERPLEETQRQQRKAAPATEPLPVTFKWIARLPREVRPIALLRQFPRVANALATSWPEPEAFRSCLYDLLVDKRGNRKGFPEDVVAELLALRAHFEALYPLNTPPSRAGTSRIR
jgi:hypothetical protein